MVCKSFMVREGSVQPGLHHALEMPCFQLRDVIEVDCAFHARPHNLEREACK